MPIRPTFLTALVTLVLTACGAPAPETTASEDAELRVSEVAWGGLSYQAKEVVESGREQSGVAPPVSRTDRYPHHALLHPIGGIAGTLYVVRGALYLHGTVGPETANDWYALGQAQL